MQMGRVLLRRLRQVRGGGVARAAPRRRAVRQRVKARRGVGRIVKGVAVRLADGDEHGRGDGGGCRMLQAIMVPVGDEARADVEAGHGSNSSSGSAMAEEQGGQTDAAGQWRHGGGGGS